ncbi:hypothetical protein K466DRAFT_605791 [Polyporus arcularius HHB13444]|uniref:Uncharacterized protein n=1 Tax=Polyporus arcularius HHB13444 TaxID=1314778 RepID=A0A5C3NT02_9APHY|nr:hypothetical protein K466DRAFT_605791 [Polyporus arcularius HHB13444]
MLRLLADYQALRVLPLFQYIKTCVKPRSFVSIAAGSTVAASFMEHGHLDLVVSEGKHALFAGTRVFYVMASTQLRPALAALHLRSDFEERRAVLRPRGDQQYRCALCPSSSLISSGEPWSWLRNIVGVSNQGGADAACPEMRPEVVVHVHSPALLLHITPSP